MLAGIHPNYPQSQDFLSNYHKYYQTQGSMSGLPTPIHVASSGSRPNRSGGNSGSNSSGVAGASSSASSANSSNPNNVSNSSALSPAVQHSSLHSSRMGVSVAPNIMAQYGSFNGYRMQQQVCFLQNKISEITFFLCI